MTLLLDSCTLIWLACEPAQLSVAAQEAMDDPASVLHVSHASRWEITLKHGAGKLTLPDTPRHWWGEQVRQWGLVELHLSAKALLRGSELPRDHKNPFDRVILAQAQMDGMPVVSPDGDFPAYGIPLLWWELSGWWSGVRVTLRMWRTDQPVRESRLAS